MIAGISFSYAKNSLQTRGLRLLQEVANIDLVCDMTTFDIPICNSNKSDGNVPESVSNLIDVLDSADILIFAISEATSHYSAGFKNAMDWLVVKSKFNARLGTDYCITDKPIFVVTFTPTKKNEANNGARHFKMTTELLEKLGAKVIHVEVVHDAWRTVVPNNYEAVDHLANVLNKFTISYIPTLLVKQNNNTSSLKWLTLYNEWDAKWKNK
tara:strand:- start:3734 stop:4369 length:636 start_codon:yes stop_codon:yes gene_type:complete